MFQILIKKLILKLNQVAINNHNKKTLNSKVKKIINLKLNEIKWNKKSKI